MEATSVGAPRSRLTEILHAAPPSVEEPPWSIPDMSMVARRRGVDDEQEGFYLISVEALMNDDAKVSVEVDRSRKEIVRVP